MLLLGTGLTMGDVALTLRAQGQQAPIYTLSRHGLLPHAHATVTPYTAVVNPAEVGGSLRSLMHRIRQEVAAAAAQGHDWRAVMNALRPATQEIWQALPLDERRRFVRHLRAYWDMHRHRLPAQVAESMLEMRRSGKLVLVAGRVLGYRQQRSTVEVALRARHAPRPTILHVGAIINCTGLDDDYQQSQDPLLQTLFARGLVRRGPLGLGLDCDAAGRLVGATGEVSPYLSTLGSPRKGQLWETTAVPELRAQAQALAERLVANA